ncbi:MAG: cell envelope biogenesis protein OmpA [Bacteroidetes bacterium HGW-Bacteroidetes-2]|jgi:chemotaxis protein MotB|nr:MAG: cell envelope biogenesis protein OmpA [Bacteroidetes bacterium HGW-Bacteroidetes-2]
MISKTVAFFSLIFLITSCVSSKVFEDLKQDNQALKAENQALMSQLDGKQGNVDSYTLATVQKQYEQLKTERDQLALDYAATQNNLKRLQDSYDALEANSSENLTGNLALNRELLTKLEEKEKALARESGRLEKLQKDLAARSNRVNELEGILAAKDAQMHALKEAISTALTNFEGKGLTVVQRDGKVYVSMENKLLFESGSWAVNNNGRQAVMQLGGVLAQNPEIAVLIEGHTDNVPYGGSGPLQDNWDLSTKRATAIVTILSENNAILKENLTAAGRGQYAPIANNNSAEGKAKNRRIEVILTPKLDEISKLLNEL